MKLIDDGRRSYLFLAISAEHHVQENSTGCHTRHNAVGCMASPTPPKAMVSSSLIIISMQVQYILVSVAA